MPPSSLAAPLGSAAALSDRLPLPREPDLDHLLRGVQGPLRRQREPVRSDRHHGNVQGVEGVRRVEGGEALILIRKIPAFPRRLGLQRL